MAHTNTWNAAEEASPADGDDVGDGAGEIRQLKLDIRERINLDHYMDIAGTDADHGQHRKVTFQAPLGADPAPGANKGALYVKDVSSKAELHFQDEDGDVIQITSGGIPSEAFDAVPSGEIILFEKDTVVAGYTLQTDEDDKLVFISKGSAAGGETGGGDHSTGTWTQPDHTHQWFESSNDSSFQSDGSTAQALDAYNAGSGFRSVWDMDTQGEDLYVKDSATANTWRPAARVFTRQLRD